MLSDNLPQGPLSHDERFRGAAGKQRRHHEESDQVRAVTLRQPRRYSTMPRAGAALSATTKPTVSALSTDDSFHNQR
jgi:hypothetical protein